MQVFNKALYFRLPLSFSPASEFSAIRGSQDAEIVAQGLSVCLLYRCVPAFHISPAGSCFVGGISMLRVCAAGS